MNDTAFFCTLFLIKIEKRQLLTTCNIKNTHPGAPVEEVLVRTDQVMSACRTSRRVEFVILRDSVQLY